MAPETTGIKVLFEVATEIQHVLLWDAWGEDSAVRHGVNAHFYVGYSTLNPSSTSIFTTFQSPLDLALHKQTPASNSKQLAPLTTARRRLSRRLSEGATENSVSTQSGEKRSRQAEGWFRNGVAPGPVLGKGHIRASKRPHASPGASQKQQKPQQDNKSKHQHFNSNAARVKTKEKTHTHTPAAHQQQFAFYK